MRQAQINVRTRACSRTSIARTKQAALTHNVRGKELKCRYDHLNVNVLAVRAKTAYKTEHLNDCISKSIQSCNLIFDMLIILPLKVILGLFWQFRWSPGSH